MLARCVGEDVVRAPQVAPVIEPYAQAAAWSDRWEQPQSLHTICWALDARDCTTNPVARPNPALTSTSPIEGLRRVAPWAVPASAPTNGAIARGAVSLITVSTTLQQALHHFSGIWSMHAGCI